MPKISSIGPQPQSSLDCDLDQVGGTGRRLSGATARIGAGNIEIAQDDVAQTMRAARIAQHDFRHQLRPAIGRYRQRRRGLGYRDAAGLPYTAAVDEKMK